MSEIAKCPLCGKVPGWHDFDIEARIFGGERSYFCCGMKASTAVLWNQYAAAMEYAKKTAYWFSLPDGIKHPDDARAEKAMENAETRVLEVFI